MSLLRRKSRPARMTKSVRKQVKRSGPAKTVQGAGMAGRAARASWPSARCAAG